jgi:phosphomannomutase
MGIFKAYDIRGLYPEEIDEKAARAIGRAFGTWIKKGPIAVGHDMRASGPSLKDQVIAGLTECGLDVVDAGLCSTPMLNFAVAKWGMAGGIIITASHNPSQYNGMKLCREQGIPLAADTGIQDLERWVKTENAGFSPSPQRGTVTKREPFPEYRQLFLDRIKPGNRTLTVVADCGNGMTGPYEYQIVRELFPKTSGMYLDPDGRFPNHEANPIVEKNLVDLRQRVLAEKADVGIAFDGDGDRVGFLDEKGGMVQGDLLLALMAQLMLAQQPKSTVLYDLRSSWAVKEEIERAGGKPVLSRVGHAFIKKTLREHDGILGGELSGHFYFKDFYYLDSGIFAALLVLEMLSKQDKPLSELIRPLDRYPRTGEVNFVVDDADRVLAKAEAEYGRAGKVLKLDGLSVEMDDWWFNLRKSNTEPLIRLNLQAKSQARLDEKFAALKTLIGGKEH